MDTEEVKEKNSQLEDDLESIASLLSVIESEKARLSEERSDKEAKLLHLDSQIEQTTHRIDQLKTEVEAESRVQGFKSKFQELAQNLRQGQSKYQLTEKIAATIKDRRAIEAELAKLGA